MAYRRSAAQRPVWPSETKRDLPDCDDRIEIVPSNPLHNRLLTYLHDCICSHRRWLIVLTILSLATIAGLIAGFVVLGIRVGDQGTQITNNYNALTQLQSDVMQLFFETVNVTIVQQGIFQWSLAGTEIGGGDTDCFDPLAFVTLPQQTFSGTYQLQNARIGSLNFTILVLSPPAIPLVNAAGPQTRLRVCLTLFDPPVAEVDDLGLDSVNVFPFTHPNLNRLSITPNCYVAGTCIQSSNAVEGNPRRDSYLYRFNANLFPGLPGGGFIEWYYYTNGLGLMPGGEAITLTEPLRLMVVAG